MCATHCSWMYRTETEADAASPVESARSSDPRFYRAGQTGSSSWLVAVRHFRHAVAGRPGPMSTRGALATMPFPSSALRNWALCARMTAAPRTADGRCPQASPPYVDRAPWSSIAWGRGLRQRPTSPEPHAGRVFTVASVPGTARPAWRGRREVYEATQDHPLRR